MTVQNSVSDCYAIFADRKDIDGDSQALIIY